ncbi:Putative amidoligase enzyme [Algoriella xinjiangensis]|uniref:amidoligase family protein n=1 Tax=Algoriella xinjiangensis TaxID=684065 RepID=UPI000F6395C3|nr:amidoligase family protein [Algoriella xinjiangensis]VDH16870.1 Putative amidoligase enzyme [Algoriella xinjiangensis]
MTLTEILNSNLNKTEKAKKLYDLGYTRTQVAEYVTNGNYGFAYNIWKKWFEQQTGNLINLPFEYALTRTFGIELETYGTTADKILREVRSLGISIENEGYNHNTRNHWKIVRDGSIEGGNGNEIVSPVLRGHEGLEQIQKVCKALRKAGAKVNASCGFHLHFGVQDFSLENFKTLFKNHLATEYGFDDIVPLSRRENNNGFCRSLESIQNFESRLENANSISQIQNIFNTRYLKLNFQSYQRYGTVEFRQHSGTTTYSKIKNWILICGRLVEFSKQNRNATQLNDFLNESLQDYVSDRRIDLAI